MSDPARLTPDTLRRMHDTIVDLIALSDSGDLHRLGIHLDGARLEVVALIERGDLRARRVDADPGQR